MSNITSNIDGKASNNFGYPSTFNAKVSALSGASISGKCESDGDIEVSGDVVIKVNESTGLGGNLTVGKNLTVTGNTTIAGNATIAGNLTITGNLTVSGVVKLNIGGSIFTLSSTTPLVDEGGLGIKVTPG
jgi:predicted acyltransferase (DUF342 family)